MVRFSCYLSEIDQRTEKHTMQKHHRNVGLLVRKRFGHLLSNPKKHILNLSDYSLSDTEEFVLEHGLEFCIPPRDINREETFAEFEILIAQLARHNPVSDNELSSLKARLSDLAHAYCGTPIDLTDFRMHREHFQAIKSLRNNKDILITKPDKGSGVVILNQKDYITKMGDVLNDNSKFEKLGDVEQFDKTARLEQKLQKRLLELVNKKQLARGIYDRIRPTGSQRPRMYGLPKTHKQSIPLRPILSMVGSAQHQLAKWLSEVLEPVLHLYSENCISDSFTFAKFIQNLELNPTKTFMCSFDVSSLFTNVPLDETIKICADALYRSELERPSFPEEVFIELMKSATSSVEFSFNNEMYRQKDGVAMGSPLGPALANIFVGFHEHQLFNCHQKPLVYFRYVDDTFAVFEKESECDIFLAKLNSLHQSLKFTFEKEENNSLPFLDVSVEKTEPGFLTSVYRKPMKSATSSVEFSFNNEMYRQKDGVAMGSPLGPALANIFVGFHEHQLFNCHQKPLVYFRYVDDTFAVFEKESECDIFLAKLNSLHQSLKFTFEKEENNSLPFLDVSVEKTEPGFLTSVYRKPTFSGLYTRWDSFCAKQIKINLINTLVHRALMICSEPKLNLELAEIKSTLINNGYPEDLISACFRNKIAGFSADKKIGPQKCPVYLKLPYIGNVSLRFERQIKTAITKCYATVSPRLVFSSRKIIPSRILCFQVSPGHFQSIWVKKICFITYS